MIYLVDIDGTLCHTNGNDYENSIPNQTMIDQVNALSGAGHTIKIFTGRGSRSGRDWTTFTKNQLIQWKVNYHELIMGKPDCDIILDDKAVRVSPIIPMDRFYQVGNFGQTTARAIADAYKKGNKVLICGNGGLASESEHFTAELMGMFGADCYIPCISLTANSALITALGNDIGFDKVFAHQVRALGNAGDILIVMTGGKPEGQHSLNLLNALEVGRQKHLFTVVICGWSSGLFEADNVWYLPDMGYKMQEETLKFLHWLALESKKLAVQ